MSDFDLIREALLRMDAETRHQVIGAMMVLRTMPVQAAVRVLASANRGPDRPLIPVLA